ncbi:MAG: hypothetical protein J5856_08575 [Lachnospiraceae bacterium]|nr:hypothetical protein [Lachnospiraceae bacterium]
MGIVFGLGYILVFLLLFVSLVCFVFVILGIINVKNKKNKVLGIIMIIVGAVLGSLAFFPGCYIFDALREALKNI